MITTIWTRGLRELSIRSHHHPSLISQFYIFILTFTLKRPGDQLSTFFYSHLSFPTSRRQGPLYKLYHFIHFFKKHQPHILIMSLSLTTLLTLLLPVLPLVTAHGAIVQATGNAGGSGMALGIDTTTPRDGTRRRPFQQDSTRFRGSSAQTFGETIGAGDNQLEAGTRAILAETGDQLPQVTPGGEVSMMLHQVNADGGGPYQCMINADATGQQWSNIQVTQNVPGRNSRNRQGQTTAFPLTASIPANQQCTGTVAGQENVCLVRCQNSARAGPFGGVVPVQMAGAAGNNNADNNVEVGNGNNGTDTGAANARRLLARSVKASEMKLQALIQRAVELDGDLRDPDVLAEFLEDFEA
ncbi:hypothetical protein QC763_602010 [Podospora pseudopauciseta]|uniref:Uncharacterized protein n=1 Tax=Podospora pseudopauciseta TaxID=2093780 RepID=A0ABR0H4V7_9PEZI|nr:hypothetical protein QC763_602010 [Podospora pseudopauciseta]